MSDTDTFITEVNDELQRDRLFGLMRKYGWIAIVAVLAIVGGAAFNEWQKAGARAEAQALGDALTAALEQSDPEAQSAAFAAINTEGDARAIVAFLATSTGPDGVSDSALAELKALSQDAELPRIYKDMAALKLVFAGTLSASERVEMLTPLTSAGAPYRTLAEEQLALAEIEAGSTEAAISRLQALLQDDDASQTLRARAEQLIVALGVVPETN